jgi:hypothetical protein
VSEDIVARLRNFGREITGHDVYLLDQKLAREAADEIERLRTQLEEAEPLALKTAIRQRAKP